MNHLNAWHIQVEIDDMHYEQIQKHYVNKRMVSSLKYTMVEPPLMWALWYLPLPVSQKMSITKNHMLIKEYQWCC